MKQINAQKITKVVSELCVKANTELNPHTIAALEGALKAETSETGREILSQLLENAAIAKENNIPLCQDTGFTTVFLDIGQDVCITGGGLEEAVNEGVRLGYTNGYLRKSVVACPINRGNTNDNTPAVIYCDIVKGDTLTITVMPKGFGSENMGAVKMLTPADGFNGVLSFVVNTVKQAGANPCPPIFVGIGIGGTMDKAAHLAKRALIREKSNQTPFWAAKETEILNALNGLNIGPGGFGGRATALAAYIEPYPTHIAGLPVAVSISCHALRFKTAVL